MTGWKKRKGEKKKIVEGEEEETEKHNGKHKREGSRKAFVPIFPYLSRFPFIPIFLSYLSCLSLSLLSFLSFFSFLSFLYFPIFLAFHFFLPFFPIFSYLSYVSFLLCYLSFLSFFPYLSRSPFFPPSLTPPSFPYLACLFYRLCPFVSLIHAHRIHSHGNVNLIQVEISKRSVLLLEVIVLA